MKTIKGRSLNKKNEINCFHLGFNQKFSCVIPSGLLSKVLTHNEVIEIKCQQTVFTKNTGEIRYIQTIQVANIYLIIFCDYSHSQFSLGEVLLLLPMLLRPALSHFVILCTHMSRSEFF